MCPENCQIIAQNDIRKMYKKSFKKSKLEMFSSELAKIGSKLHWIFRILDSSLSHMQATSLKKKKKNFRNTFAPILLLETALFDNAE